MSQAGDNAADARLNDMLRMVGTKKSEPLSDPQQLAEPVSDPYKLDADECAEQGHEFAYEDEVEAEACGPMRCIHCGAEDTAWKDAVTKIWRTPDEWPNEADHWDGQ